jgi:hypothetical protein
MADEFLLVDHPPARTQFYPSRARGLSGGVGWHTTESILDRIAAFTGAEAVARYIRVRTDAGSYSSVHELDGRLALVPWTYTTFSIATSGFNSRTMSIAAAMRASEMDPDDPAVRTVIASMADETFDFWRWLGLDADAIRAAAHWSRDPMREPLERPCLFNHGDVQADRSDAFARHARRSELERLAVGRILARLESANPQPAPLRRRTDTMRHHVNSDGRNEFIDLSGAGVVVNRWEDHDGVLGLWQPTHDKPPPLTSVERCWSEQNSDGRIVIYVAGPPYGDVWMTHQTAPSAGPWVPWYRAADLIAWLHASAKVG